MLSNIKHQTCQTKLILHMLKNLIVARSINHVIGKNGQLPWHLPKDLKRFKTLTLGHHVIMGRKTYESLPNILPGRKIIVITSQENYSVPLGILIASSLNEAFEIAAKAGEKEVFIAGGATIYQAVTHIVDKIYLTVVHAHLSGDTFFPVLENHEWEEIEKASQFKDDTHAYHYDFITLVRKDSHFSLSK